MAIEKNLLINKIMLENLLAKLQHSQGVSRGASLDRNLNSKQGLLLTENQLQQQYSLLIDKVKYLLKNNRTGYESYYYKRCNRDTKIRSFAIVYNYQTKELDCNVMCNSKDSAGNKICNKSVYVIKGSFKVLKLGSCYNFATWPPEERVKILHQNQIQREDLLEEYQTSETLGPITKFNKNRGIIDLSMTSTYISSVSDYASASSFFSTACQIPDKKLISFDIRANGDLYSLIKSSTKSKFSMCAKLSNDLSYMHKELRMVHLDIKPENILFDSDYNLFFADFGFSEFLDKDQNNLEEIQCGTYPYLSPQINPTAWQNRHLKKIFKHFKINNDDIDSICTSRKKLGLFRTDPRKHDMWAMAYVLFYIEHNKLPNEVKDTSNESASPLYRILFSVDDEIRPSAEEALVLLYVNFVAILFDKGINLYDINKRLQNVNCENRMINKLSDLITLAANMEELANRQKSSFRILSQSNFGQQDVINCKLKLYENFNLHIKNNPILNLHYIDIKNKNHEANQIKLYLYESLLDLDDDINKTDCNESVNNFLRRELNCLTITMQTAIETNSNLLSQAEPLSLYSSYLISLLKKCKNVNEIKSKFDKTDILILVYTQYITNEINSTKTLKEIDQELRSINFRKIIQSYEIEYISANIKFISVTTDLNFLVSIMLKKIRKQTININTTEDKTFIDHQLYIYQNFKRAFTNKNNFEHNKNYVIKSLNNIHENIKKDCFFTDYYNKPHKTRILDLLINEISRANDDNSLESLINPEINSNMKQVKDLITNRRKGHYLTCFNSS